MRTIWFEVIMLQDRLLIIAWFRKNSIDFCGEPKESVFWADLDDTIIERMVKEFSENHPSAFFTAYESDGKPVIEMITDPPEGFSTN